MKKTVPIIGMACSACSANVQRKLDELEGIRKAQVNLVGRSAFIDYDENSITLEQIKKEINSIGYDMVIEENRSAEEISKREYVLLRRKTILSWIFSVAVMAVSMQWINLGSKEYADQMAMLIAIFNIVYCGKTFYITAIKQLRHGTANMDTLVALSTGISFIFSTFNTFWGDAIWGIRGISWHTYFDASVMIITFVLTGRLLEEKAKDSTATSIRKLMGMAPKTAHIVNGQEIEEVPISTIEIGDLLEVRPGEKFLLMVK